MYRWGPGRARRGNETLRLSTSSSSLQPIPLALFTSLLFCPLFYSRYLLFYSPSVRAWRVLLLTGGERPLGHITHLDLCVLRVTRIGFGRAWLGVTNIVIIMGDYRQGYADTTTTTTTTMPHEGEEMMDRRRYDRSPEGFTYEFRDVDLTNGEKGNEVARSAKKKSRFCPAWLRDGDGMPHFTSLPSSLHKTPYASKQPFPSSPTSPLRSTTHAARVSPTL